jgi:hypothetical protein
MSRLNGAKQKGATMKKFFGAAILAGAFSMLAMGADLSGNLLDASCYSKEMKAANCNATAATTSFVLMSSGKVYKLDTAGNEKVVTAMKTRADRSKDPTHAATTNAITATVSGTVTGDTIQVESVTVQ